MLVGAERRTAALENIIGDDDDVAIAAITVAELLVGVELADRRRRDARKNFVEDLVGSLTVEPYDLGVARHHAVLLAHVRRVGSPRGAHDIVIAATAAARRRAVVTADTRGFADLPGVVVREA